MTTLANPTAHVHDDDFDGYMRRLNARFEAITEPLFTVDTSTLWSTYLDALPDAETRRYHDCFRCRQFVERFGGLVTIDAQGRTHSAIWVASEASTTLAPSVRALARSVERREVAGAFVSAATVYGTPTTTTPTTWSHLAVRANPARVYRGLAFAANEVVARVAENVRTLRLALAEFDARTLTKAVSLLETEALYRSEACLGVATFLLGLHPHRRNTNRLWRAAATALPGFCTPRSGMIGTLLEDLDAGLSLAEVKRRFAAKMHPLAYLRPKAAPTAGTIARAEVLFERLGLGAALERRFARLDELKTSWTPREVATDRSDRALFAHLRAGAASTVASASAETITWAKFERSVLPKATALAVRVPAKGEFVGMLSAVHEDAPRLFQWNHPVSAYVYVGGSEASRWNLDAGSFVRVTAIADLPRDWETDAARLAPGRPRVLVLAGAYQHESASLCLFPETIRSELHGVRAVIEAHSKSRTIRGDASDATANGILITNGSPVTVRATLPGAELLYRIDRVE